jgi:hypothetical protein
MFPVGCVPFLRTCVAISRSLQCFIFECYQVHDRVWLYDVSYLLCVSFLRTCIAVGGLECCISCQGCKLYFFLL